MLYHFCPNRNLKKHGRDAVNAKDNYVATLLDQFVEGEAQQAVLKDACAKQRNKCLPENKKQY